MPTTLYTDRAAVQLPAAGADTWTRDPGLKQTGNVLYMEAIYTIPASGAPVTADIIRIAKLAKGTRLLPELCKIVRNDPGTSFNIAKIGDSPVDSASSMTGDDDRYSTAIDISAAGTSDFAYAAQAAGLAHYTLEDDAWLIATLGTISTLTAGQTIKFLIAYVAQN